MQYFSVKPTAIPKQAHIINTPELVPKLISASYDPDIQSLIKTYREGHKNKQRYVVSIEHNGARLYG